MTSLAEILNGRELEAELQDVRFNGRLLAMVAGSNGRAPEHPPESLWD